MATIFGLCRPSSPQNICKKINAGIYNVIFVNVMGSRLKSYSSLQLMPAVVVLSVVSLTYALYKHCYNIKIIIGDTNCISM
jgi:hypothetical protein